MSTSLGVRPSRMSRTVPPTKSTSWPAAVRMLVSCACELPAQGAAHAGLGRRWPPFQAAARSRTPSAAAAHSARRQTTLDMPVPALRSLISTPHAGLEMSESRSGCSWSSNKRATGWRARSAATSSLAGPRVSSSATAGAGSGSASGHTSVASSSGAGPSPPRRLRRSRRRRRPPLPAVATGEAATPRPGCQPAQPPASAGTGGAELLLGCRAASVQGASGKGEGRKNRPPSRLQALSSIAWPGAPTARGAYTPPVHAGIGAWAGLEALAQHWCMPCARQQLPQDDHTDLSCDVQ